MAGATRTCVEDLGWGKIFVMTPSQRTSGGGDDLLAFLRSDRKLGPMLVVSLFCLAAGAITGATTSSSAAKLVAGVLLILGGVLLVAVGVLLWRWRLGHRI